ncbi:MAG: transporter substrate-binding domain-containing protein, partial [Kordiimonadaceae bacterium]|nr:transporter substrate-binding domain-containing protein [Kordiimonadaceae bacterium]
MVHGFKYNGIAGLAGWRAVFAVACGILLSSILSRTQPLAAGDVELRMGYVHFPPHSYTEDGKPAGFQIEIARKLFAIHDLKYEMVEMPALRLIRDFAAGRVHVWMGAIRSPKLAALGIASKKPTGVIRLILYSMRQEQPLTLTKL